MSEEQNYQSGDVICRLLNLPAAELKQLVDNGVIPKEGRDKYLLVKVVRSYVEHIRDADNKPASQIEIAAHLGMSDRNLRDVLKTLELDFRAEALRVIRIKYIEHLRGAASGHQSQGGHDLVYERVLTEQVDRQLKELTLAEKLGQFVVAADVAGMFEQLVLAFRSDMLALADLLKTTIDAAYDVDVDIELINEPINDALQRLSSFEADAGEDSNGSSAESSATSEDNDDRMGE